MREVRMLMQTRADGDGVVLLLTNAASVARSHCPTCGGVLRDRFHIGAEPDVRHDAERLGISGEILDILADRQVPRPT
jgi:hypothetical protein